MNISSVGDKYYYSVTNCSSNIELDLFHNYLYGTIAAKCGYYFMMFLLHVVGVILLLGVVLFETFGGDAQKRNILNRLVSVCCANQILVSITLGICRIYRDVDGLIDISVMTWIEGFGQVCILSTEFFLAQMTILRFLYIVIWKRVRILDDSFWTTYLAAVTYSWAISLTIISKHISQLSMRPFKIYAKNTSDTFEEIR